MKRIYFLGIAFMLFGSVSAQDWYPLGSGQGTNQEVFEAVEYQGDLVIGGRFQLAGGQQVNRIARWDGSNWQPMGVGFNNEVRALAVYNGELYAAGIFDYDATLTVPYAGIARWNGSNWVYTLPADPLSFDYRDLYVMNGEMYATKHTYYDEFRVQVSKFNGTTWIDLPGEFSGPTNYRYIYALGEYQGNLVAAGVFDTVAGIQAQRIALFNGVGWESLDFPVLGETPEGILRGRIESVREYDGKLFVGGIFTDFQGLTYGINVASYDGENWTGYPFDENEGGSIFDFEIYEGRLIAAGDRGFWQGDEIAAGCLLWDPLAPGSWRNLNFFNPSTNSYECYDMAIVDDILYVGGKFSYAGSGTALVNNVARFDGILPTGIFENKLKYSAIGVYPNPAAGFLMVDTEGTEPDGEMRFEICQMDGRQVFSGEVLHNRVELGELHAGAYLIRIYQADRAYTAVFFKE